MNVILFDIDGTLVRTGGAGKTALEAGLCATFAIPEVRHTVSYSGRTDLAISRDLLAAHDVEPSVDNERRLLEAYLARLPDALKLHGGRVCPGVVELLEWLAPRPQTLLGLLTGNVRAGARLKLSHFGLWDYFRVGGFGDYVYDRDDVARAALQDIQAHLGADVDPSSIWVVGDTPLDVRCARAIGARAVAVATGWHSREELAGCRPDLLLEDLSQLNSLQALWA